MKLVIDRNFIGKKTKNLKILTKTCVMYLKRKLKTYRNQIHVERVGFVLKKAISYFFDIFSRGFGAVKFDFCQIFQFFQFFFQKWPQWDLTNIVRNKVMKNELIWSILRSSTRDYLHGWAQCAPPRVE